ncbi:helix-turn-helix transcriptional regulator [Lachnospiraceae bacterium KGMB03038]|nr:helix-turn-helix transcriptional regulator [Lachnospiraceae bacterium KGMB03038]
MSKIIINIEAVLAEKGVSKTQLCYACRLQRTQLNNYCKNKVSRIDLNTLAKICDFLQCDVGEILRLEKEDEQEET